MFLNARRLWGGAVVEGAVGAVVGAVVEANTI